MLRTDLDRQIALTESADADSQRDVLLTVGAALLGGDEDFTARHRRLVEAEGYETAALALVERKLPPKSRALHFKLEATELLAPSGGRRSTVTLFLGSSPPAYSGSADTLPLAIILALLRALSQQGEKP